VAAEVIAAAVDRVAEMIRAVPIVQAAVAVAAANGHFDY